MNNYFLGSIKIKKEEEILLFDLLPDLEYFCSYNNEKIKDISSSLILKITTRDTSWYNEGIIFFFSNKNSYNKN